MDGGRIMEEEEDVSFFLTLFLSIALFFAYLDGVAGDLYFVEFAHGAIAVDEV